MARQATFEELPVGACFAFDEDAKKPTRRKVDAQHTVAVPGGTRPMRVGDVDVRVSALSCQVAFGRRRKRRKARRS
jgi:hypothetical protein